VPYLKSEEDRIDAFARYLREREIMVTVRRSRGKDIDAACGQLANKG
jgi:23S rRNA (adenine2503-C2)-methyltransferase